MRKIMDISRIFVKANIRRFISAICTMCTFLLIFNILVGFILSTTGVFSNSLTNNSTMHFMEVIFDGEPLTNLEDMQENFLEISKIESVVLDFSHPVQVESLDGQKFELLNLIGVPKKALKYFDIKAENDSYFYLPESKEHIFEKEKEVLFEEGEYYVSKEGEILSRIATHQVEITSYYDDFEFDMLPPNLAIIDENRMLEIVAKMSESGDYYIQRLLITVDDISNLKEVEGQISNIYPQTTIRYSLKYSNDLPSYSVVLIAGSSIVILVLFIICIINIRNNVNQILNSRNRDIALLSLFGTADKMIAKMFLAEFFSYGMITFIMSTGLTLSIFQIFKLGLDIDFITDLCWIYILINLLISLVVFGAISLIQVIGRLKKLNKSKMFKEFLK